MGGIGSGNRFQSGKHTTEDMRVIDIYYLQRQGLLTANRFSTLTWSRNGTPVANIKILAGNNDLTLMYKSRSYGEEWEDQNYAIKLERTPCHYGAA